VNVTATDPSPTFAATLANSYVQQFIKYQQVSARSQIVQAATQLQSQINRLRAASPSNRQLPDLETRLSQLQTLASIQTGNVQIAEPALVPTAPSSPRTKRAVALGFIGSLLVGLLAVFLAEQIDRTLRDPDDAKELVGLPLLGMIPFSRALSRTTATAPLGPTIAAETFRLLRSQLRYFNVDREINSVLVTSAAPGDGKSTVAWNLARTAASLAPDSPVLIVDSDLRRASIAEMSMLAPAPGLAEILTQDLRLDEVVQTFEVDGPPNGRSAQLHVLTAGAPAPNPSELMESQKLRRLVEHIHATYNFVIFDAPPTAIVSDAIPLMTQVSGVLVVVRLRHTRRDAARRLHEQLVRLGAPALGLILNGLSEASSYKGYAGYEAYAPTVSKPAAEPAIDVSTIE
jgi:capsular exopolysaccharide synthesis family protein